MKNRLGHMQRRQGFRCHYCNDPFGKFPKQATTDHLVPVARGGTEDPSNKVASCWQCNNDKGPLTYLEFMEVRHDPVKLKDTVRVVSIQLQEEIRIANCRGWWIDEKGFHYPPPPKVRPGAPPSGSPGGGGEEIRGDDLGGLAEGGGSGVGSAR